MASQHPDHASKPYWHDQAFIRTADEAMECFLSFSELGISEYKWDWEGKLVDESMLERLLHEHTDFFTKNPLGLDIYLTFRLPNPKTETEFRMGRALMGILNASSLAKKIGLPSPAIFEAIIPMVESATQMMAIKEAFAELQQLKHPLYKIDNLSDQHLEIIPLFESIDTIINSDTIIAEYLDLHRAEFNKLPPLIRPYLARSDPTLTAGLIPGVIAVKIALARYQKLEKRRRIALLPILGIASLPFRGGLTPYNTKALIREYAGVKTFLLQSAFRYEYPKKDVIKSISAINKNLQQTQAQPMEAEDEAALIELIHTFENFYKHTIEGTADLINKVAQHIPKRRERLHHAGPFGYARQVGSAQLPRAISFTAALYSLGIPPEMIGTGRSIKLAQQNKQIKLIEKYYLNIKDDIKRAGKFVNKKILTKLAKQNKIWHEVIEDITYLEAYVGTTFAPHTPEEKKHQKITEKIFNNFQNNKPIQNLIEEAGKLRKSLG